MEYSYRLFPYGLLALVFLFPQAGLAGVISYSLSLTGTTLSLTQNGDSSAYYPAAFRLIPDGRWERLAPVPGKPPPAEMTPGMRFDVTWPETQPLESLSPLERLRPIMVRFFDQAGVSFGQISLFDQPPRATESLRAGYMDGLLSITPPADGGRIRASWILWPQEEGIAPIRSAVSFSHIQPPARRIEWRSGMEPVRVATGGGQPVAILLHETAQGYTTQHVPGGGLQGRQQRAAWLDASSLFYRLAMVAATAAAIAILVRRIRLWRGRTIA